MIVDIEIRSAIQEIGAPVFHCDRYAGLCFVARDVCVVETQLGTDVSKA
jgi:hypothetical protein